MKKHNYRKIKIRRRKVANLAAYSRQFTVKNNTIKTVKNAPEVDPFSGNGAWKHEKYPRPKNLTKKEITTIFSTKKKSTFSGIAEKMEAYVQNKLKKWEKKHPKPCADNDLFREEMIPQWEKSRQCAEERIRDFVVSVYDKLPLIGRFKQSENKFEEKQVAQLKDQNGESHRVNELDPSKSKLLKKAQEVTNKIHTKNSKLVCTNLKDHKRHKGRIILPKAA